MGRNTRPRPRRLATKLRQIRTALDLSQAEMVKSLRFNGIYQGHVSEYERGVREPPYPVQLKYARLAGVSTDVLIDDKLSLREKDKPQKTAKKRRE